LVSREFGRIDAADSRLREFFIHQHIVPSTPSVLTVTRSGPLRLPGTSKQTPTPSSGPPSSSKNPTPRTPGPRKDPTSSTRTPATSKRSPRRSAGTQTSQPRSSTKKSSTLAANLTCGTSATPTR
jgi:hypothetical protein